MKSMRDRAAQLAGSIEITSIPNVGTTVALTAKIVPAK